MAVVDSYAPCPCGSGQKFKWCCQKVESYVDRAERAVKNGQNEAALEAIAEGLRKVPDNPWLLIRQATLQIRLGQPEAAKESLRQAVAKQPKHFPANDLLTRLVLETEGPIAAIGLLQTMLTRFHSPQERDRLASLSRLLGTYLALIRATPSARKHAQLSVELASAENKLRAQTLLDKIEGNPEISLWLRNPYQLAQAPAGLTGTARADFDQAVQWAQEGQWSVAAAAFDRLAADHAGSAPEVEYNLGLCRLWLADSAEAVDALRRYIARIGETIEAVDLEALCQLTAPVDTDHSVERVQLIWPAHDREALLKTLRGDPTSREEEPGPIDPNDPASPEVNQFVLLDRLPVSARPGLRTDEIPWILGRVLVGQEIVALEAFDDGRLDTLSERFTAKAGRAIPPAHPRTKVLGRVPRTDLALSWNWFLPDDLDEDEVERLSLEQQAHVIQNVWPETPQPYLKDRSPLQAAAAGDARVPLRAALLGLEETRGELDRPIDFGALRKRLNLDPKPRPDPATVDIERLHAGRLSLVPTEEIDEDRLVALYKRAQRFVLVGVLERTARILIERPSLLERHGIELSAVYTDLVNLASGKGQPAEAREWITRGRQADPPARRAANTPYWDMFDIRVRAQAEEPTEWVPDLAVLLDRYGPNENALRIVVSWLLEMGLLQMVPNPDEPGTVIMDSQPLHQLLQAYGPRVTTSTGLLGVSATRGGLWTPGGPAEPGGGTGIWTPGSTTASAENEETRPKLILP
jgi:tetratricopeptide (TPR) repeat protein